MKKEKKKKKETRITNQEIFIKNLKVGRAKRLKKLTYSFLDCTIGFRSDELRLIARMMDKYPHRIIREEEKIKK